MPPTIKISITGSNTADGSLELDNSNNLHHLAVRGAKVRWEIENNSVDSITVIKVKGYSDNIWRTFPSPVNRQKKIWTGEINTSARIMMYMFILLLGTKVAGGMKPIRLFQSSQNKPH